MRNVALVEDSSQGTPMRTTRKYWHRVHSETLRDTNHILEIGFNGRFLIAVVLFFIYVLLVWRLGGKIEATSEVLLRSCASVAPFLSFPLVYLWNAVRIIPKLAAQDEKTIGSLKARLTPALQVSLPELGDSDRIIYGRTSETVSGRRQTVGTGQLRVLMLRCRAIGPDTQIKCRAILTDVRKLTVDGDLESVGFVESIDLSWSRALGDKAFQCEIVAGGTAKIYVLASRMPGSLILFRDLADLPVEYHQITFPHATYRFWVQVSSEASAPRTIVFDARSDPETGQIISDEVGNETALNL
jgi:hypothetical protein